MVELREEIVDFEIPEIPEPQYIRHLEFSYPQKEILETTAERVLFLAGVGSGKSEVIGTLSMDYVLNNPEVRGFIGANTYRQLSNATLDRVFNVWEKRFGLVKGVDYVVDRIPPTHFKKFGADLKSYENTISFENGALIFVASLENWHAIDGLEFGWACLDETKDTREEAVKECIIHRLRQKGMYINPRTGVVSKSMKPGYKGYNPLYIFTSPSKTKWLSDWFKLDDYAEEIVKCIFDKDNYFRKQTGRYLVVISSTYHNKVNLPEGYIEGLIEDLAGNENLIDMLIYGSPFGKTGGEFCTTYSRLTHVKEFELWTDEAVHISFDFNVIPYITATMYQLKFNKDTKRYKLRAFDEFCLENPKNDSESLCDEIITYYERELRDFGLFYYGDYSGGNESTVSQNIKNNYQAIELKLQRYLSNSSKRVIPNKGLEKRRRFLNKLFKGVLPVDIEIHPKCKELRGDLEFCKVGPDGGKLKSLVKNENKFDGKSYQDRGHALDSFEYMVTSAFNTLFNM